MQTAKHPQAPADVQHALQSRHFGQELGLHGPPPDPDPELDDDPPEELDPPAAQEPTLQTWPDAQLLQASPPEPHAVGSVPPWHVLVESQQPAQLAPEHPVASSPPLEPPLDPLLDPLLVDPLSSPPLDPLLPLLLVVP